MDCEKFDSVILDELYGDLDELTSAAAKRHVGACARCSARMTALRAVRRVSAVPLEEPAADLEGRILASVHEAWTVVPLRLRAAQAISLAGSWAMRPQTAMGAVFLVMIGTSVLLLRGKSARSPVSAEVVVTEQGTPAPATSDGAVSSQPPMRRAAAGAEPTPTPLSIAATSSAAGSGHAYASPLASPIARGSADGSFDAAIKRYRDGHFDEATRAFDALAPADPLADLWAARSIREEKGCRAAVARFDAVAQRARQTPTGSDALLEAARCYRALGDSESARARLVPLLGAESYKERARTEIDRIDSLEQETDGASPAKPSGRTRATSPPQPTTAAGSTRGSNTP